MAGHAVAGPGHGVGGPAAWAAPGDVPASQGFRKAVTLAGIREHQAALQAIADANGGNRAAGTSGYDASAEYVAKRMAAAGYQVSFQEFTFGLFREAATPELERRTPTAKIYTTPADFRAFTGSGEATGEVVPIDAIMPPQAGRPAAVRPRTSPGHQAGTPATSRLSSGGPARMCRRPPTPRMRGPPG